MVRAARSAPLLLLAVLVVACAVTRPTAKLVGSSTQPLRRVLTNGARVVVQEMPTSEIVALQLWVRAGSRDEAPSELGLAHYLEHMLFKGTSTRSRGFVEREVEGAGGRINAGTARDFTYYHAVVPPRRALDTIELLADVAVNATLAEPALELEKKVLLEEMQRLDDSPHRRLLRLVGERVFDGHPYGRPVLGTPELVAGLSREALVSFYRRHYVPESFALVVVGPVRPADVLGAAERTFGRMPRGDISRFPAAPRGEIEPARVEATQPGSQAHLALGWLAPRLDSAEAPAVELLAAILGRSRSARLVRSLREKEALVTSISSTYAALEVGGRLAVTAQLEPDNLGRAEGRIVEEIRRLQTGGVSNEELRRAATAAEAQRAFSLETAEGRAFIYGRAETTWRLADELAHIDRIRSVTAEQVRSAARRYLDPERYVRVALVPRAR